jgi:hypothetical protein
LNIQSQIPATQIEVAHGHTLKKKLSVLQQIQQLRHKFSAITENLKNSQ